MFKVYKKEIEVAGKKISLETGKVARQAETSLIISPTLQICFGIYCSFPILSAIKLTSQ